MPDLLIHIVDFLSGILCFGGLFLFVVAMGIIMGVIDFGSNDA